MGLQVINKAMKNGLKELVKPEAKLKKGVMSDFKNTLQSQSEAIKGIKSRLNKMSVK